MARISDMHKRWMKEPKYKKAYQALEGEFVMASAVMDVRNRTGLTQQELAEDGNDSTGCRTPGKRARTPVHANARAACTSYRIPFDDQVRTAGWKEIEGLIAVSWSRWSATIALQQRAGFLEIQARIPRKQLRTISMPDVA